MSKEINNESYIKVESLNIGDLIKSNYNGAEYILSFLPKIINNKDKYALIRKDGCGYCYLNNTLKEVRQEIYRSGEEYLLFRDKRTFVIEGI